MRFSTLAAAVPLLAGIAVGQTPPGFQPEAKDRLEVIIGTAPITPGQTVKKSGMLACGYLNA